MKCISFRIGNAVVGAMGLAVTCMAGPASAQQQMFAPVISPPTMMNSPYSMALLPYGGSAAAMRENNLASFARCVRNTRFAASIMKTTPGSSDERQQFVRLRQNNLLCGYFARQYPITWLRGALEDSLFPAARDR